MITWEEVPLFELPELPKPVDEIQAVFDHWVKLLRNSGHLSLIHI